MDAKRFLIALTPWVLFALVVGRGGADSVGIAALLACLGSLALAIYGVRHGGLKIIDAAGVITFAAIALAGLLGSHQVDEFLVHYGRGGAALVLATIMAVSAFTVPFTEQYARETVDPQYWDSPIFRAKNRAISLLWAATISSMAVCHLIAGALAATSGVAGRHPGNILLNWAVPILLILWAARRTEMLTGQTIPPGREVERDPQDARQRRADDIDR
jgi:hypothetical protein